MAPNQLPTPASLLLSADPTHALRLLNTNKTTTTTSATSTIYSRPQPPSKRPRHAKQPSQRKNSPSPPLSSDHEPPPEKDRAWAIEQDDLLLRQLQSQPAELRPALPLLPPTPLTPLEIIKSSTLSRLFRKSNRVFSQIADSATGLIESDSSTCNKLNELVELLRGDLSSRSWIDVIEQSIAPAQAAPEKADTGQLHYQVLAQTLETIHGLFTTPPRSPSPRS
ncbi:hypothetical protein PTTG_04191, partial [Puccinia triticina 1-1 BBBD Race 1]